MGFRPNNRRNPWQRSSPYNYPLLVVIPSEAEGSAVLRTFLGNVFWQSIAEWSEIWGTRELLPGQSHP
jgi:hypothetical protein